MTREKNEMSDDEEPPPLVNLVPVGNDPPPGPDLVRERDQHYGQHRGTAGLYAFREGVVDGQRQLRNMLRAASVTARATREVIDGDSHRLEIAVREVHEEVERVREEHSREMRAVLGEMVHIRASLVTLQIAAGVVTPDPRAVAEGGGMGEVNFINVQL